MSKRVPRDRAWFLGRAPVARMADHLNAMRYGDKDLMQCELCPNWCVRKSPTQKYCPSCSEEKNLEYKRQWANRNPASQSDVRVKRDRKIQKEKANAERNRNHPLGAMWWDEMRIPRFKTYAVASVPFEYGWSKNAIWRSVDAGHVVLREEAKALREALAVEIKQVLGGRHLYVARLWLDVLVEKPDHRGDAVNVLDSVSDAVEMATGVDDRWYSVRRLEWRVVKGGGRLVIGIGQAALDDERVCHRCGRVFSIVAYTGKKRKGRVCQECRIGEAFDQQAFVWSGDSADGMALGVLEGLVGLANPY